jgi:hypothetical protein
MNHIGQDGTWWEIRLGGLGCVWKLCWNTVLEWQKGAGDIIPNGHEQYFPFSLGHQHSYFRNEITLFSLIYNKRCVDMMRSGSK